MRETEGEKNKLLQNVVEMERELMKTKRAEKVLREMEQRYLTIMDSAVFLCFVLAPDGKFRAMNRRAEDFFGFQMKLGVDVTFQSFSGPEAESMLKNAMKEPLHVTLPVICADKAVCWLDMECSCTVYHGDVSIQVMASDITGLMKGNTGKNLIPADESESSPIYALQALNSCPGLLCFVVDKNSMLLYSTRGYREIARRFLGHECACGLPYPISLNTPFDLDLQDLIQGALLGSTSVASLTETGGRNNRWNVTGAPLVSSTGTIVGAIINLTSAGERAELERPQSPQKPPANTLRGGSLSQAEFLNAIPRMFFVVDDNACCVEANANFLSALKLTRDEVIGHSFDEFLLDGDPVNENMASDFASAAREGSFENLECKVAGKNGEALSLSLRGTRLQWESEARTLVSCVDNTRLRRTEEQLKRVSTTDVPTGTLNRQGMERALSTEIERAVRYRGSLALIMLDIDGFRQLNERLGYVASDKVLRDLAAAIKSRIRLTDFLGRWGGDEFMILTHLPLAATVQLAEKLRDMTQHMTFGDNNQLTLSAGVAALRKSMDISSFVGAAYDAMIEAKKSGGNRTVHAQEHENQLKIPFPN